MPKVALFITHQARPGQRDALHALWAQYMPDAINNNPGHEHYFYCLDEAEPDTLRVFQLYRDETAASAFLNHPSYLAYKAASEHLIERTDLSRAEPVWFKTT